jgi:DNA adenine methylase
MPVTATTSKPFLKWAGGKGQLIDQIQGYLPHHALKAGGIKRYIEPFIGGGALFFYMAQQYPTLDYVINDANRALVVAYTTLQQACNALVKRLEAIESAYLALTEAERQTYFYQTRTEFNQSLISTDLNHFNPDWVAMTAQLIFLNKTCFNGLFRVNAKGQFNVPFGRYKNPTICAKQNLQAASALLKRVTILHGDYAGCKRYADDAAFVYFDPPYRPLNKTSAFTAYAVNVFNDEAQLQLAKFYQALHAKGAWLMLSNADPHNEDATDDFFDVAYQLFNRHIINATRMINSKAAKRGPITELLVTNY